MGRVKRSVPPLLLAWVLLPLAVGTTGCGSDPGCLRHSDCTSGLICRQGRCAPPLVDGSPPDAGPPMDAASGDAGAPDGGSDAAASDSGRGDGGRTASPDAGTTDASTSDAGARDASTPTDAGPDAARTDASREMSGAAPEDGGIGTMPPSASDAPRDTGVPGDPIDASST